MKTKHLLYSVALAGLFAACSDEEYVSGIAQSAQNADRPTVSNVSIEMGEANTRLEFNDAGSFVWEEGDSLCVMLMDENNIGVRYGSADKTEKWNALSWLQRYHLVDYVHTNYPFAYDVSSGSFVTSANMLEGNYFLAYPYVSFTGQRQAYFDISKQKQIGNTSESRRKAYADNQRFIGYAKLDAGSGASEIKANMMEVLAPVRINIRSQINNEGQDKLQITKIVLMNDGFTSQYTINPTYAPYGDGKWNLTRMVNDAYDEYEGPETYFNYANYLAVQPITASTGDWEKELYNNDHYGSVNAAHYVFNAEKAEKGDGNYLVHRDQRAADTYYFDDAIRETIKPLNKENYTENTTNYVEVYTYNEDGETPYTLESGDDNTLGVIAMVPSFTKKDGVLNLYIYTNRGVVGPVDLSTEKVDEGGVITTDEIECADPTKKMQTVTVQFNDYALKILPSEMIINNTNDLEKYVDWATKNSTSTDLKVILTNDVTINDDLAAKIKLMKEDAGVDNAILYFESSAKNEAGVGPIYAGKNMNIRLDIKNEENAKILESIDVSKNILVEVVAGSTVSLTQAAHNYKAVNAGTSQKNKLNILVDKGGVLNIVDSNKPGVGGWGSADLSKYCDVLLTNNGAVNVKAEVSKNAGIRLTNEEGTFNVENGAQIILAPNSKNTIKGTIVVAEGGELSGTTNANIDNYGVIENAGELYNVNNNLADIAEKQQAYIVPGRVKITGVNAQTILATNAGKVIYDVLPTEAVVVSDDDYVQGMFEYSATSNTTVAALTKAHVTDFVITGATLSFTKDETTTLRHLTMIKATLDGTTSTNTESRLKFASPASGTVASAAWNNGKNNTIKILGNSTVKNSVPVLNNTSDVTCVYLESYKGEKDITFSEDVRLYNNSTNGYAIVDLNAVTLTADNNAAVQVKKFTADQKFSSTIKIKTGATITATEVSEKYDATYILVSGGTIK